MTSAGKMLSREPSVHAKRFPELSDLEIWDLHNWMRPSSYCLPTLSFGVAAADAVTTVVARCDGVRTTATGAGLLIGMPGDFYVVERITGRQPAPGERTLIGIHVPVSMIESDYWSVCSSRLRSGLSNDSQLSSMCRKLAILVRSDEISLCDRESHVLRFVNAAFPAMARATDQHATSSALAVRRTREFIDANWRRPFSLSEGAKEVGVSKWHLTRNFARS